MFEGSNAIEFHYLDVNPGLGFGATVGIDNDTTSFLQYAIDTPESISDGLAVRFVRQNALSIAVEGTGSGSVVSNPAGINCPSSCATSFDRGTSVTLTPNAAVGSRFAGWTGDCTGTGPCIVPVNSDKSVKASFADATAPDTKISKKPKSTVKSPKSKVKVKIVFSSTEAGSTFRCKLDKGAFQACSSPKTLKVKPGRHTFQV